MLLKKIAVIPIKLVAGFFYDRKYLRGRFFDVTLGGWVWVWRGIWKQKIGGVNRDVPWPCSPLICVQGHQNITFHPDDLNNFQTFGCYFQCPDAEIVIGRGTYIAPNVGIITSNHAPNNLQNHLPGKPVRLGTGCWIGMNSVILPGVELGNQTIVGAGSVVTKSFLDGGCVIAGNPARFIRKLKPTDETTNDQDA